MTNDDKKQLYAALSATFPEEAIERSQRRVTGRGYDTTGIKYQYIVNRLNEVLGIGGYRTEQKIDVKSGTNAKGRTVYDATCEVTLSFGEWKEGMFEPFAEAFSVGGHTSVNEADARKGAFTNGFKKCAAMFGCGKQAYEGTIDDDNVPSDDQPSYPTDGNGYSAPQHTAPRGDPRPQPPPPTGPQTYNATSAPPPRPQSSNGTPSTGTSTPTPSGSQTNNTTRNRLSSKQLAAIWALARKLNMDQRQFREQIKARFKVQPEFLDKTDASTIIGELAAKASNGAVHPASQHTDQPGAGA